MLAWSICVSLATELVSFMKSPNKTKQETFLVNRQNDGSFIKAKLQQHGIRIAISFAVFCPTEAKLWGRDLERFSLAAQMFTASASHRLQRARATAFLSLSGDAVRC